MKIGIDASFLRKPGTGIGQVTFNFLEKLKEHEGMRNTKYILYTEEPLGFILPENFEVRSFLPHWWRRDDVVRKLLWEKQVAKEASKDGCDFFLSLYQSATFFRGRKALRHLMVVHDIIPKLFPEYLKKVSQKIHWRAIENGIRNAGHIIAISESTKKDLVRELGIDEEKISVAHPGLSPIFNHIADDAEVERVMKKYHLDRGYIYHGGGLEVRKNGETLLRAYDLLCKNFQFPISNFQKNTHTEIPMLVISGKVHAKSNPLATDVEALVSELGLGERVKLLGFVPDEDLPALYRGAVLFAYPSLYEGFGLPPLEAMSQGTPVIVSDISSLPEICGDAALYVDPSNATLLADKMALFLGDANLRKNLSEKGIAQSKRFSWDNFVKAVMQ